MVRAGRGGEGAAALPVMAGVDVGAGAAAGAVVGVGGGGDCRRPRIRVMVRCNRAACALWAGLGLVMAVLQQIPDLTEPYCPMRDHAETRSARSPALTVRPVVR